MLTRNHTRSHTFPAHGRLGLLLVAVVWPLNWSLEGLRTHVLFFPLWLGYILVVDAWLARRAGASILTKRPIGFALLFLVSVPVWWLFEGINGRLQNWEYVGGDAFGPVQYFLISSLNFSTVVPAVMCTSELVRSFGWIERFARGPRLRPTRGLCLGLFVAGWAMAGLMFAWPRVFYPFEWISLVFILEPVCVWFGRRSFLSHLRHGDWRTWMSLWIGCLVCGLFWEMWNLHSNPRWIYHIPYVAFFPVFEMPILGYLGYLPFSMELYLVTQLALPRPPLQKL